MSRARAVTVRLATLAGAGASAAAVPTGSPTAADAGIAAESPDGIGLAGPPGSTAAGKGVTTADAEPTNVTYGEPNRDETARSALRTDDGGYVLTGTVPGSDGETETFVARLGDRGSGAWTETLEFTVGGPFGFDGLDRAHADGYLVGGVEYVTVTANGTTADGVPRARLVALDAAASRSSTCRPSSRNCNRSPSGRTRPSRSVPDRSVPSRAVSAPIQFSSTASMIIAAAMIDSRGPS
jgi:hypothetical protein